uniref:ASCH domain-containing protein n=1 Tax=Chrysotila carterae TaxID=13221 RepID=A0A7S4BLW2_CHRCT
MSDLAKIQDGNVAAASSDKSSSGAGLYRKGSDPFANSHSKKDNSHGGSKSGGGAQGRGKAKRGVPVKAGKDLGSLHSALRPGRQVCYCNARRHALLHNCLSCGKVICEQEGEGACLFCGGDPHAEGSSAAAIAEASRRAERLLEFDRSAAKRTAVIDDQADYFGHAAADVWLSEQERAAAAEAQQARDAAAERRRRELRVTLDFDVGVVRRDDTEAAAAAAARDGADASASADADRQETFAQTLPRARAAATAAGTVLARTYAGAAHTHLSNGSTSADRTSSLAAGGRADGGLRNPSLATRALFVPRAQRHSAAASGGDGVVSRAQAEGLSHSVCKVQHDNPWLEALLQAEEESEGGFLEGLAERGNAERQAQSVDAAVNGGGAGPGAGLNAGPGVAACGSGDGDRCGNAQGQRAGTLNGATLESSAATAEASGGACLSMHQPWASLLVHGIKKVEGRSWRTAHRGWLWIAATAREPDDAEIAEVEARCAAHHAATAPHAAPLAFPSAYPTAALLGGVYVTDCLSQEEYRSSFPQGEENSSAYVFLCAQPRTLTLPIAVKGSHKIWHLEKDVAAAARNSLRAPTAAPTAALTAAPTAAPTAPATKATPAPPLDLLGASAASQLGRPAATIALKPIKGRNVRVLQDGLVLLKGVLDVEAQQGIVQLCRDLGVSAAGFYAPKTRDGAMHLHMMCLGKHWNPVTNRYEDVRSNVDSRRVPPLPPSLWSIVADAAAAATDACASIPAVRPGICLANFYSHAGRLGMHQARARPARYQPPTPPQRRAA